jgi:hypothetical protein
MCTIGRIIVELFWPYFVVRQIVPIVVIIGNKVVMMDNMRLKYIDLMAMRLNMRSKIKQGIL